MGIALRLSAPAESIARMLAELLRSCRLTARSVDVMRPVAVSRTAATGIR
jgi:hypothetical protein